jgi:hypothetical protein
MFENGQWYQGTITGVDYVKSPTKGTPALEITVEVSDLGQIVGYWWLTESLVNHPADKTKKVPMWEAARVRCLAYGCDEAALNGFDWVNHIGRTLVGQPAAVCAEVNEYGDVKASFIGKPKGKGAGMVKQDTSASPFANRRASPSLGLSDDDLPW